LQPAGHQYRIDHALPHGASDAFERTLAEARVATRACNEEIEASLCHFFENNVHDLAFGNDNRLEIEAEPVEGEVLGNPGTPQLRMN